MNRLPLALLVSLAACTRALAPPPISDADVAFVGFHVLPMDSAHVLRDYTVLVKNGVIASMGPSKLVTVPAQATRIRGGGRYLMPALADLHTHTAEANELPIFVAYGVTTILNLGWSPLEFVSAERHRYARGELLGPVVLEGRLLTWPWKSRPGIATLQQARDTVALAKIAGYEFIKVYSFLSDSVFAEIVQQAHARGIPMVGHVTYGIGLERALVAGVRMIAHAEELTRETPLGDTLAANRQIDAFLANKAWLAAGLSTYEAIANSWGNLARLEDYIYAPVASVLSWARVNEWVSKGYHELSGSAAAQLHWLIAVTGRMHAAGVSIVLGTDAPGMPGMVPGFSAHEELRVLRQAGLSNFEALATGTRNAGRFIAEHVPRSQPFGLVRPGQRADFIISERNPLDDLRAIRVPLAVVRAGRVLSRPQLDSMLNSLKRK